MNELRKKLRDEDLIEKQNYIIIPNDFINHPKFKFSPIELLLISKIEALSNPICWASNEHFAKMFNVSEVTISKAIQRLIKMGCVKDEGYNGRNRFISCSIISTFKANRLKKS